MATIQWFPGHMSKARRQVQENLKFVDFVTVLVDARLPLSSQNPMLTKIVGEKPKLMILNKVDLLPYLNFDVEKCIAYAKQVNPTIEVIQLSSQSGEGLQQWLDWLKAQER